MAEQTLIAPIQRTVTVRLGAEAAFRLFTEGFGGWWPLGTHSIGEERAVGAVFEPGLGGRIYERLAGGAEADWGKVLEWDPPRRVVFAWKPNSSARPPTEVEVSFTALASGETRVDLEHRGWEWLGEIAADARATYDAVAGWDLVLARYVAAAAPSGGR